MITPLRARTSCANRAARRRPETLFDVPVPRRRQQRKPEPATGQARREGRTEATAGPTEAGAAAADRPAAVAARAVRADARRHGGGRHRPARPARRDAAGRRLGAGRTAADRGRSGHRQDPHADPPDRVPLRRAGRLPGALPGDHVHPAGRRGAAGPARRPARRRWPRTSPWPRSTRSAWRSCGRTPAAAGLPANFRIADDTERTAARAEAGDDDATYVKLLREPGSGRPGRADHPAGAAAARRPGAGRAATGTAGSGSSSTSTRTSTRSSTSCCGCSARRTATCARSATRTRRSTRSAAPTWRTSCGSRRTSPTPGWSG